MPVYIYTYYYMYIVLLSEPRPRCVEAYVMNFDLALEISKSEKGASDKNDIKIRANGKCSGGGRGGARGATAPPIILLEGQRPSNIRLGAHALFAAELTSLDRLRGVGVRKRITSGAKVHKSMKQASIGDFFSGPAKKQRTEEVEQVSLTLL